MGQAKLSEIARILRKAADAIEGGETFGGLHDSNGNAVGCFDVEQDSPMSGFRLSMSTTNAAFQDDTD